jgi:hypothetical protein
LRGKAAAVKVSNILSARTGLERVSWPREPFYNNSLSTGLYESRYIEILSEAQDDLVAGAKFYERRRAGLGEYFLNSLYSDTDSFAAALARKGLRRAL